MHDPDILIRTTHVLVIVSLIFWTYTLCLSIDYWFLPARSRSPGESQVRRAALAALAVTLVTLLLLLTR